MALDLEGIVRTFARIGAGARRALRQTDNESLAVAQMEPPDAELARAGRRFQAMLTAGFTGRAPVTAVPTTAAAFLLWNGEVAGGKSYLVEEVHIVQLSGTASVGHAVLWALTTVAIAQPTAATGYAVRSRSRAALASKAVFADNQTLAVDPSGWGVLQTTGNPATTPTGGGVSKDMRGSILIPPGYGLALNVFSGAGTAPLYLASPVWSELALTLE